MSAVAALELLALAFAIAAGISLSRGWEHANRHGERGALTGLIVLTGLNALANAAEWADWRPPVDIDAFEDSLDLLSPAAWVLFLGTCAQGIVARRLRESRELVAESEQRFRAMVENAPEAIVVLDADEGRFVDFNEKACTLLGVDARRLVQLNPAATSPELQPDGRRSVDVAGEVVERALAGEVPVFDWVHRRPDGTEVPCEVRLVRLPAAGRRLVRGSITDRSERLRAERERAQLESERRSAQKLQAVGTLASGVAHDFNNLLTVIGGHVDLALADLEGDHPVRVNMEAIAAAASQAAGVTRSLLTFAAGAPVKQVPVDVGDVVRDSLALLRRLLPANLEIVEDLPRPGEACVRGDPVQLQQVLLNLALNACDAMPEGGRLGVSVGREGESWVLTVTDEGSGMDEATAQRAFEPFFTTKVRERGTGLGLSVVHGIVSEHGGTIRVDSTPDRGTRVRIELPACDLPSPMRGHCAGAGDAPEGRHVVLVAEDQAALRDLVERALRDGGHDVVGVGDGEAAMAEFRARRDELDAVVLDVDLPKKSGLRCLEEIRELSPDLPVLLVTGDVAIAEAAPRAARERVLLKPFRASELRNEVTAMLRGATVPRPAG